MPAKSQAQRKYLAWHFGSEWMKKHGYDNKGPLPAKAAKKPKGKRKRG